MAVWYKNRKSTSRAFGTFASLDAIRNVAVPPGAKHFQVVYFTAERDDGQHHASTPWLDYPTFTPAEWVAGEDISPQRVTAVVWDALYQALPTIRQQLRRS